MIAADEKSLEKARTAYTRGDWADAFRLFSEADDVVPLDAADLESFAMAAALIARDEIMLAALDRLYQLHLKAGRAEDAAQAAFWSGFRLFALGEIGHASAWMQRAQRLIDDLGRDCVISGYLHLPAAHQSLMRMDYGAAIAEAEMATAIGERFGDRDLAAFARNLHGRALIRDGRVADGLAQLDAAMLDATGGALSPLITGLVYCSVIATCCQVYAMDRAREWTEALAAWCDAQPQLAAFAGICMVHRAEIMQMNGAWPRAIAEVREACRCLDTATDREAAGAARYQEGELQRLRGEFSAAEKSYREASQLGREPQPGLALLRLAQGQAEAAAASIRQVVGATESPLGLARLLPAYVEIMLATGAHDDARRASGRLASIAGRFDAELLGAMAAQASGAVELAAGNPQAALAPLRTAFSIWHRAGAPYIAARIRVLMAAACEALDDHDGASLERDAARAVFEKLGAKPDLAALRAEKNGADNAASHGLTPREREVLRLVAEGMTNRAIAGSLGLSAKTVDRHLGNIFNKLDVSSRAAATACAYEYRLL